MRIGIIGDIHYGASLTLGNKDPTAGINSRQVDYDRTLIYTIDELVNQKCSQIVFTGDIFEHRTPTIKQQEMFSAALRHAIEMGIEKIHIVVGNHDQQRFARSTTLAYIKELPLENIYIYDEMDTFTVLDEAGIPKANLIFMPFRDKRWLELPTNSEAIEHIDQQLAFHVSAIDNDAPKIVVGHMTIEGTLWMVEQYSDLYNGNDLILPKDMFNSINITVMGHVHTPGIVSRKPFIAYVGSMEKRSASEDHKKKYMVIDLETKKVLEFDEPCRDIYDISIDFSNSPKGEGLMSALYCEVDSATKGLSMKGSIVRVLLTLSAIDDKFCKTKDLESYIGSTYQTENCLEIKPSLIFSRQARDEKINEHSSDTESFRRFTSNEFGSHELQAEILAAGIELLEGEQ